MKGTVVIISGASRGLGRALALGFADRGASVGICSRDKHRLEEVAQQLAAMRAPHVSEGLDISHDKDVERFVGRVASAFGRIDVLINNASILGARIGVASYPVRTWDEVMAVNINGAFYLTKHALKIMLAQNEGSIINVSSSVGRRGRGTWGAYAASKFALEGLTEVLADELSGTHIRVNSVNPGAIATAMRRDAYPEEDQTRLKRAEEILEVFFYLASADSESISGHKLDAQYFHPIPQKVN